MTVHLMNHNSEKFSATAKIIISTLKKVTENRNMNQPSVMDIGY